MRHFISLYQVIGGVPGGLKTLGASPQTPGHRDAIASLREATGLRDDKAVAWPFGLALTGHRRGVAMAGKPWGSAPNPALAARQAGPVIPPCGGKPLAGAAGSV